MLFLCNKKIILKTMHRRLLNVTKAAFTCAPAAGVGKNLHWLPGRSCSDRSHQRLPVHPCVEASKEQLQSVRHVGGEKWQSKMLEPLILYKRMEEM